jgi:hypothetical protein
MATILKTSSQLMLAVHVAEDATVTLGMLTTAAAQALETTSVTSLHAGPTTNTAKTTMKRNAQHATTSTHTQITSMILMEIAATGTGAANTDAMTSTPAISLPQTTVAHAVVDVTVIPMIKTAVAYKMMALETQRPPTPLDVLSVNAGTTITTFMTDVTTTVMHTPVMTNYADEGMADTITSRQLTHAVPAVADVIATHMTFITVVASTIIPTSALFQHAPLRKEKSRTTTWSTAWIHLCNVISMTTSTILASALQT